MIRYRISLSKPDAVGLERSESKIPRRNRCWGKEGKYEQGDGTRASQESKEVRYVHKEDADYENQPRCLFAEICKKWAVDKNTMYNCASDLDVPSSLKLHLLCP
jgi:hypothetical protein